jgi:branched-chain amino acid transport system substrate-binding protein
LQRFTADSKVVALIGPNSDSVSTPLTDPVNKAQIVSLVTSGAGGRPNADFGKWMFSIPVRNDFIVNKVAAALKDLGLTKIAIVYSTSRPFAAAARDYMTAAATKNGLTIVGEPYGFADADVNFSALITKIKSGTQPQAIFCSCLATAAGPMILQAKNAGLSARWVSDASLLDPNFYKLSQNSADGTLVATPFDTSRSDQVVKTFLADFKKKYNKEPNVYAAYGYDTALLFINALKSIKGDVTRESVRAAIAGASFDGATGRISFPDGQGVAARADVFVVQMKEGAYVPVTK